MLPIASNDSNDTMRFELMDDGDNVASTIMRVGSMEGISVTSLAEVGRTESGEGCDVVRPLFSMGIPVGLRLSDGINVGIGEGTSVGDAVSGVSELPKVGVTDG